jgi:hypothetical protein
VAIVVAMALAACSSEESAPPTSPPDTPASAEGSDPAPVEPDATPPAPSLANDFDPAGGLGDCVLSDFFGTAWKDVAMTADLLAAANDVFAPLSDVTGTDSCGSVTGDPHVVTPDGFHYDFHAVGEFVALAMPDAEIQLRLRALTASVSVVDAVAARVGSSTVQLGGAPDPDDFLLVDGEPVDDEIVELADGGFVIRVGLEALVVWPQAAHMLAVNGDGFTDVVVRPGAGALDAGSEGILGAIDGDPTNDPQVDGTPIDPRSPDELYGLAAPAWLVDETTTLFTYAPGEGPATFHDPDAPSPGGPSAPDLEAARTQCVDAGITEPNALARCAFDLAVSGDEASIESARRTQSLRPGDLDAARAAVGAGIENSRWSTSFGEMVFGALEPDGTIVGEYAVPDGALPSIVVGVLDEAGVLRGEWYEDKSGCSDERRGYSYWGPVEFRFDDDATTFDGNWSRCDSASAGGWSGTRLGDATPRDGHGTGEASPSGDTDPADGTLTIELALTADQVVTAPGATAASGTAAISVDGDELDVLIEAFLEPDDEGIEAALHLGEPGLDGPVLVSFGAGALEGDRWVWRFTGAASAPLLDALDDDPERLYVEIVTVAHPTGALRGGFGP